MDTTGLIATASLNTTAQTALAAGTYASAEVDVLKITALQESDGSYLGLPATNITAQGKFLSQPVSRGLAFQSPGFNVNESGKIGCIELTTQTGPGVFGAVDAGIIAGYTRVMAPEFKNNDSSFITDSLGNCTVNQLTYTSLNPPLPAEVIPTLSQVLTAGSDAGNQPITNVEIIRVNNLVGSYRSETEDCGILKFNRTGYHNITGVSDGLNVDSNLVIPSLIVKDSNGSYAEITSTGAINCTYVNNVDVQFKPTYDYYVSKGGSDNGLGSILNPYLTIQKAITECELITDGVSRVIHVSAGSFTENLTFSKSRISIKGEGVGSHPDTGSAIYGNITITIADGNSDLNNNNITLSGFLIVGLVEDNTTLDRPHRLILDSCHIYGNTRCLYTHPVFDYRVFVSNCVISNDSLVSTDPLVQCAGLGMVSFTQTQMEAKGASQIVFKLSGTCRIDLFAQNILTSDSIGTNVAVAIFNHNSSQTITLGQNAFVYSSVGAKRNAETASGVFMNSTGSLVLLSNTFSLSGMASSQMAVYSTSLSFPTTIIIYGANVSTSNPLALTATGISGSQGTTKVATLSVQ